jgi:putative heme-binding domain-containing protein
MQSRRSVVLRLCKWLAMPVALGLLLVSRSVLAEEPDRVNVAVEALRRLKGVDLEANPSLRAAVLKVVDSTRGTPQFVELVREFNLKGQSPALLDYAIHHPTDTAGIDALRLVLANGDIGLVESALQGSNASALVQALGNSGKKEAVPLLERVCADESRQVALRKQSVQALAQTQDGAEYLVGLADSSRTSAELKSTIGLELRNCRWAEIRAKAAGLSSVAETPNAPPLPPIRELAAMKGNAARGAEVFKRETVGCAKCHQVHGFGADVGPNLSEIGTKLAKEAIYEAILDPSAGIAFGYEAWEIELKNGDEAYGLMASQTSDEIAIKAPNGIITRHKKSDIARQTQQKTSLMPGGLARTMSQQDLVDLVAYLASLKKE